MTVYSFVRKNDHNDIVWAQDINELQAAVEAISAGGGGGGMTGFSVAADSGTPQSITDGNTLTIVGGTGIDSIASATDTVTLNIDSTVATLTGSQTLTNKTLTAPAISSPTGLVKADVGLGNVDNTSDATKNSASATLANKTLTTPTIGSFTNATHNHTNAAGGGQITDAALSSAVSISKGGTGQTTAQNARNALLPTQTNNARKVLSSDGTDVSWVRPGILFKWKAGRYINLNTVWPVGDFGQTQVLTANSIYATPLFVPPGGAAIDRVTLALNAGAGTNSRLMYFEPGSDGHPGALLFDFGTVNTSSGGDKELTVSQTLPEGPGWLAVVPDGAITAFMFSVNGVGYVGDSSFISGTGATLYRANGGTTAPNPFGTTSISYLDKFVRLGVRAA